MILSAPTLVFSQHGGLGDEPSHKATEAQSNENIEEAHNEAHNASRHAVADRGYEGQDHADEFVPGDFIIHHIADANEIHLFGDVSIPLPIIIYVEEKGLDVFMSSAFHDEHGGHGHGPTYARGPSTNVLYTKGELGITAAIGQHLMLTVPNACEGNQQTAQNMASDILQEEIPITSSNTWGLIDKPGLGVEIDEEKLQFFHQKFAENGEYKLYGDKFPI